MRHLVTLICGALFALSGQAMAQDCASLIQARIDTLKSITEVAQANPSTTAALVATIGGLSGALNSAGFTPEVSGPTTLLGAAYCAYYASDCAHVTFLYFPLLARLSDLNSSLKAKACFGSDTPQPSVPPPPRQTPVPLQSASAQVVFYNPCATDDLIAIGYFLEDNKLLRVRSWFRIAAHQQVAINVDGLSSKRFFIHRSNISDNSHYSQADRLAELPLVDRVSNYNIGVDAIQNRTDGAKNIAAIKDDIYDQAIAQLGFPNDTKVVWFYSRFAGLNNSVDDTFVCP